jgi:hypothetical protein
MKLEAEGQHAIVDPQDGQIESAVAGLAAPDRTCLILSRSKTSFVQVAIIGANRLDLEWRDGSAHQHVRSARDDYSSAEVVAMLEAYRSGDDSWTKEHEWRPIDGSTPRDRTGDVSLFCRVVGFLLVLNAVIALKGSGRDPVFGLETMDALAIGLLVAMVGATIDLRRFRTLSRREKPYTIGVIGTGLMVVTIQLIEHLRAR